MSKAQDEEITVESALKEMREMFPTYKYFSIQYNEGAPAPRVKVIAAPSYHSSRVRFVNGETLTDCMAQMRDWKESQQK